MSTHKRTCYDYSTVEEGSPMGTLVKQYESLSLAQKRVFCSQLDLTDIAEVKELEVQIVDVLSELNKRKVHADEDLQLEVDRLRSDLSDAERNVEEAQSEYEALLATVSNFDKRLSDSNNEIQRLTDVIADKDAEIARLKDQLVSAGNTGVDTDTDSDTDTDTDTPDVDADAEIGDNDNDVDSDHSDDVDSDDADAGDSDASDSATNDTDNTDSTNNIDD